MIKSKKVSIGNIYAVSSGTYMGEFWVLMDDNGDYQFLSLPDFKIRRVVSDKFKIGIDKDILEFQEKLPKNIFNDCFKKYNSIKLSSNAKDTIN